MTVKSSVNKKDKLVVFSDAHFPHQDDRVIDLWIEFAQSEQPQTIVLHEMHDFYAISRFDKDPTRADSLQDEIDIVDTFFARLRKACPRARIILLQSNHLDRLRRFLWREASGLASLRALTIEELLNLKRHRIEYMDTLSYNGVLFKHGDIVRKFSSYTAKGEFEREGMSGCSGHTHRLGVYFHRLRGGFYVWVETGCGCKLDAEYVDGITNWQHGFAVFGFDKKGRHFYPTVVPIIEYRIDWGNKTFIG